jgi:putative membrane protein
MRGILLRLLLNVLGLWLASSALNGIYTDAGGDLVWAAIALGLVNAVVRPVLILLTLPFTLATLGLFLLFINAAMLNLAAWAVDGFYVEGVFAALVGAFIVTIVGWAGAAFIGENGGIVRVDRVSGR